MFPKNHIRYPDIHMNGASGYGWPSSRRLNKNANKENIPDANIANKMHNPNPVNPNQEPNIATKPASPFPKLSLFRIKLVTSLSRSVKR